MFLFYKHGKGISILHDYDRDMTRKCNNNKNTND